MCLCFYISVLTSVWSWVINHSSHIFCAFCVTVSSPEVLYVLRMSFSASFCPCFCVWCDGYIQQFLIVVTYGPVALSRTGHQ